MAVDWRSEGHHFGFSAAVSEVKTDDL